MTDERDGGGLNGIETPEADGSGEHERVREGITMALYISLSLLAVLLAMPRVLTSTVGPAIVVVATSVGLILAHVVAFRIASRLVHGGRLDLASADLLAAQAVGGAAVTVVAVVPVLLLGGREGIVAAELVLSGFVALVGYLAARAAPLPRWRALVYVGSVVVVSAAVIWVKTLVNH